MPAITLQVMVNAPTHDLSYNDEKFAMRHRNGDILAMFLTRDHATLTASVWNWDEPITSPRSVFVHITDFPANLAIRARDRLTDSISATGDALRIRKYRIPPSVLTPAFRNRLLADKEATVTFTQAKRVIRKKVITVLLDPTQDDETTELVDGDLL